MPSSHEKLKGAKAGMRVKILSFIAHQGSFINYGRGFILDGTYEILRIQPHPYYYVLKGSDDSTRAFCGSMLKLLPYVRRK